MSLLAEHRPETICVPDSTGHCLTCSDEAAEATVLQVDPTTAMALVAVEQAAIEIDVSLIDAVAPGDRVLIHGGVALSAYPKNTS